MNWWESILIGIASGIVASGLFFLIMSCIRPNIKISDEICREKDGLYRIKVVNLSRCMLFNLKYSLQYEYDNGKGVKTAQAIKPNKEPLIYLNRFKNKKNYYDYAIRITYDYVSHDNQYSLPLIDETHAQLVFTVIAEHSLSGKSKCIKKAYRLSNIQDGKFQLGESTEIIEAD